MALVTFQCFSASLKLVILKLNKHIYFINLEVHESTIHIVSTTTACSSLATLLFFKELSYFSTNETARLYAYNASSWISLSVAEN